MISFGNVVFWLTSSSSSPAAPTLPGGVIAWIVCYRARRSPIGGWLLFFYWQLYGGLLMTSALFAMNIQSYVPENFDSGGKCALFLLSVVPSLILYLAQIAVGTILLSVRTWDVLKLLRWLIVAQIVAGVVSMVIDANYFPDNTALNLLTVIPQSLWLAYFLRSVRVKHVFKSQDWDIAVNTIHPMKPTIAT